MCGPTYGDSAYDYVQAAPFKNLKLAIWKIETGNRNWELKIWKYLSYFHYPISIPDFSFLNS